MLAGNFGKGFLELTDPLLNYQAMRLSPIDERRQVPQRKSLLQHILAL